MLKANLLKLFHAWNMSNIFEWTEVKRAQFVVLFSGFLSIYMLTILWLVVCFDFNVDGLNLDAFRQAHTSAAIYVSLSVMLFIVGFYLTDASHVTQGAFVFLGMMIYSLGNVIALYYVGVFSIVGGVALSGGPVVGLLLFNWRTVLLSFFFALFVSLGMVGLSLSGRLPYAALANSDSPLLFDYSWFMIVSALVIPQVVSILYIAYVSVKSWHLRESMVCYLSQTDELTQLSNRRVFMEKLLESIAVAKKQQMPLSLLMMDLDYFKKINDEHGHQVGDKAIQITAKIMQETFRNSDNLARYGGEEFCITLANTSLEVALDKAEELRKKIDAYQDEMLPLLNLSASIGLFTWNPRTCPVEMDSNLLLKTADDALYQAKADGRNCVRVGRLNSEK